MNRNMSAFLISLLIAILILGFIFGSKTEYIWAAWLIVFIFTAIVVILALNVLSLVQSDSFDTKMLGFVVSIILYLIVFISNVSFLKTIYGTNSFFNIILGIRYIIYASLSFLTIYSVVRFIQSQR